MSQKDAPDPMNIGRCEAAAAVTAMTTDDGSDAWNGEEEQLGAISHHTQCFQCGGYGHMAQTCSTPKGKGKGHKGVPKGSAKGDPAKGGHKGSPKGGFKGAMRKGPIAGCWTCGGNHFASEFPYGGTYVGGKNGGGKGKGFNMVDHHWPQPTIRPLSAVRIANRYSALSQLEEEKEEEMPTPAQATIADFTPGMQAKSFKSKRPSEGRLSPLVTIEPDSLNPVVDAPQWELLEIAVDSGASETVIPENAIRSAPLEPSDASRRGVMYEVANGHRIANLGQKTFSGVTEGEGLIRGLTAQVCDVNKPLLSVSKLVQSGNNVYFSAEGSYVEDSHTKERVWLQQAGGMYTLKLWVPASGVF